MNNPDGLDAAIVDGIMAALPAAMDKALGVDPMDVTWPDGAYKVFPDAGADPEPWARAAWEADLPDN